MIPYLIVDPRSQLQKARRPELARFARANGITEYVYPNGRREPIEEAPAVMIRKVLMERGLTRIQIPNRSIGTMPGAREPVNVNEVSADADLERQFMSAPPPPEPAPKPISEMGINELRAVAKAKGIKLARGDTIAALREKLGG